MYSIKSLIVCSAIMLPLFANAQQGDPKATEVWEPVPVKVTPGTGTAAPSDAIVLFDGKNLNSWESDKGGAAPFVVKDGAMTVTDRKSVV